MTIEEQLRSRSGNKCELCESKAELEVYDIPPYQGPKAETSLFLCKKCREQFQKKEALDPAHWATLTTSMWSELPAVQVMAWRMLNRLKDQSWAADALDMLYLDDELLKWARAEGDHENQFVSEDAHRDCNGAILQNGDNVTLIKSLDVKGSQINAKIGTSVKNIKLVADNTDQIEGKIEGQQIVILTKYTKKA